MRKVIGWKVPQVFVIAPDEEIDIRLLSREKHCCDQLADFLLLGHEAKVRRASQPTGTEGCPGEPEGGIRFAVSNSQERAPRKGSCLARAPVHQRSSGFALDLCPSYHSFTR